MHSHDWSNGHHILQDILGRAVQSKRIPTKQRGKEKMRAKSIAESRAESLTLASLCERRY